MLNSSEYPPVQQHGFLKYLPGKLAEFIGNNFAEEMKVPDQLMPPAGRPWSVEALNLILRNCLVEDAGSVHLRTFGTLEWESDFCMGKPKARCYPLDISFYGKHPQVENDILFSLLHVLVIMMILSADTT